MSEVIGIILGLVGITGVFAYYSNMLRESESWFNQQIAVLLAFVALMFVDITMFVLFKVAEQSATYSYLTTGGLKVGYLISVSITTLLTFALLFALILNLILAIKDWYAEFSRRVK